MKRLYLYTKPEDRMNWTIQNGSQEPMAEGEIRELYVDNKRVAVIRAVPSDKLSCSGCYLKSLQMGHKGCMIPTGYVNGTAIGGLCCRPAKVIIKTIDDIMENL